MAKGKYQEWLTKEGLLRLEAWARDGLTDEQIAHNMGIARSTLNEWKKKYSDFSDALKKGKEVVDIEVENALLKKSLGFKVSVKKAFKVKKVDYENGKRLREYEEVVQAEEEVYIPPDVTAQIFWLKNRKPAEWRDKKDVSLEMEPVMLVDDITE